jgi:hypothetical protein
MSGVAAVAGRNRKRPFISIRREYGGRIYGSDVQSWRKPREEQKEEERGENGPKLNQLLLPNATIE